MTVLWQAGKLLCLSKQRVCVIVVLQRRSLQQMDVTHLDVAMRRLQLQNDVISGPSGKSVSSQQQQQHHRAVPHPPCPPNGCATAPQGAKQAAKALEALIALDHKQHIEEAHKKAYAAHKR